jgi:transcriptional regulator with XRE-family HTH domain
MTPKQLDALLKANNETRTAFAKRISVTARTVQRWLSGQHPIPKWLDLIK